jgi:hypothetical protein
MEVSLEEIILENRFSRFGSIERFGIKRRLDCVRYPIVPLMYRAICTLTEILRCHSLLNPRCETLY